VGSERVDRRGLEPSAEGYLELAALNPEERSASLRCTLEQVVRTAPVAGTALIRPRVDDYCSWSVKYVGPSTFGFDLPVGEGVSGRAFATCGNREVNHCTRIGAVEKEACTSRKVL
jgi:hypothetical protein